MRKQFIKSMEELGAENPKLVAVLGDISVFALQKFKEKHPERFFNMGICEQAMVSIAAGLVQQGWIPVVHTIAPFIVERAYEQVKIDVCYQKFGVNLISVGAAFDYTPDGPTHHCWGDFGLMRVLPGMEVLSPGSPAEFDALFRQTYANGNPTYIRISANNHGENIPKEQIKVGKALVLRTGAKATIVATGPRLKAALFAADALGDVEVVYVHTIKPFDDETVRLSAAKTKNVLTVEEHSISTGLGAAVSEAIEDMAGVRMKRLGVPNNFVSSYGTYDQVCAQLQLDGAGVLSVLERMLKAQKVLI